MVKQTIQIFARVKPAKKNTSVYSVDNEDPGCGRLEFVVPRDLAGGFINNKRESYKFRFQRVFDQGAKQEEVFETIAKPVADSVLAGYNGTIFAYGQTGSGKTFTITGGAERYSDRGIIPRTLSYLYQHLSQNGSMVYTTHISYLEIYNEAGYDLLDPQHEASRMEDLPKVTIMEDPDQNIHLKNLSLQPSANEEEALNLLFLGDTNRMIAETPMNEASTRSHCIFTIHLCGREPGSATLRRSKLHLVDLAGSERVGKTGVGGLILTEAKYINLSLHYLEQVIIALSEKNRSHIPYRNSMMTSVLRDSLGGNCMTTMIATVAVDKRNVDESISTCRFAQRVAQIKNEALLNEELDPALLIVRLRREIQALREELAMVTGEQRTDDLTQEEIHRLEEQVNVFLEDPDSEVTLDLGPDMRKIHHCFSLLKAKVRERPPALTRDGDGSSPPGPGVSDGGDCAPADVVEKLRGMLTQRDNEISILVSMLKKEKRRVQEANAQLASVSRGDLTSRSSLRSPAAMSEEDRNGIEESTDNALRLAMSRKRGPELSMGCQEALEIFRRDHEDRLTIEDNKAVLKQRFAEAKALGVRVNQARGKVNELKRQLELRRMQVAAQGVAGVTAEAGGPDLVEEKLREQIEEEKKNYKNAFTRLKGLKTEIEHLQLLLERAKLKVQRDFQAWWTQETARLQQKPPPETAAISGSPPPCGRPSPRDPGWMRSAREHAGRGEMEPGPPTVSDQRDLVPRLLVPPYTDRGSSSSSELSALSSSGLPSAAPLTGDQQTDMDILAFIRARQNLLSRNGAAKGSQ